MGDGGLQSESLVKHQHRYERDMETIHAVFQANARRVAAGTVAIAARAAAVDRLVGAVWGEICAGAGPLEGALAAGVGLGAMNCFLIPMWICCFCSMRG